MTQILLDSVWAVYWLVESFMSLDVVEKREVLSFSIGLCVLSRIVEYLHNPDDDEE